MLRRRVGTELPQPTGLSAVGVEGRGSFWEVLVGRPRQMGCRRADVSGMAGIISNATDLSEAEC